MCVCHRVVADGGREDERERGVRGGEDKGKRDRGTHTGDTCVDTQNTRRQR